MSAKAHSVMRGVRGVTTRIRQLVSEIRRSDDRRKPIDGALLERGDEKNQQRSGPPLPLRPLSSAGRARDARNSPVCFRRNRLTSATWRCRGASCSLRSRPTDNAIGWPACSSDDDSPSSDSSSHCRWLSANRTCPAAGENRMLWDGIAATSNHTSRHARHGELFVR